MAKPKGYKLSTDISKEWLKKYLASDIIAIDTELQGLQMGRDQVCLVQVCDRKGNVCLIRIDPPKAPPNLKTLLTDKSTIKLFHYALTDVAFLQASLGIKVTPFRCTKVMSKMVRTYTEKHNLKSLLLELLGVELSKENQSSNWDNPKLSKSQLQYAANDVLYLIQAYDALAKMIEHRGKLVTGITLKKMNENAQDFLPNLVELLLNGYGDKDRGWETTLFNH